MKIRENKIYELFFTSVKTVFDNTENPPKYKTLNHPERIRVSYSRQNFVNDQVSNLLDIHRKEILISIALQMVRSQDNMDYFPENHFLARKFPEKLSCFKVYPICRIFNWRQMVANEQVSHIVKIHKKKYTRFNCSSNGKKPRQYGLFSWKPFPSTKISRKVIIF